MFIQVHQQSDVIALFYLFVAHYFHVNGTLRHKKMQFNLSSK